jgi:hypothetical protein
MKKNLIKKILMKKKLMKKKLMKKKQKKYHKQVEKIYILINKNIYFNK